MRLATIPISQEPPRLRLNGNEARRNLEDPPLTAIVKIKTTVSASGVSGNGSASNGWSSYGGTPDVAGGATEHIVKSNPGETFTMSVSVSASGPYHISQVGVEMVATPVRASVSGCIWHGTPLKPQILMGEKATGSLSADGYSFVPNTSTQNNYQWAVPGTIFKSWDPFAFNSGLVNQPKYDDDSTTSEDLEQASPFWYWKGLATASRKVVAQGKIDLSSNNYNPDFATVSDDITVEVIRPDINLGNPNFTSTTPWATGATTPNLFASINTQIICDTGTVDVPTQFKSTGQSGGTYAFVQVITNASRASSYGTVSVSNKLDGTFPYAYNQQAYGCGANADFNDSPYQSTTSMPVSASDAFALTVIFKSDAPDAQWIPLSKSTWSWNATLSSMAGITLTPSPIGSHTKTAWGPTADHPSWVGVKSLS